MWDEKKFFRDYTKAADRVQPEPEFVDKMVFLVKEEMQKENSFVEGFEADSHKKVRKLPYAKAWVSVAAAACIIFVLGVGRFNLIGSHGHNIDETQVGPVAGTEDELGDQMQSFGVTAKEESLQEIVDALQKGSFILSEQGAEATKEEKEELLDMVVNAVAVSELETGEIKSVYKISGEEEIIISVMENNTFIMEKGDSRFYYQIVE